MLNFIACVLWAAVPIGFIAASLEEPLFPLVFFAYYGGLLWLGMRFAPKQPDKRKGYHMDGDNKY